MESVRCVSFFFFFPSRRRHTRCSRDWSSDVCSSDLVLDLPDVALEIPHGEIDLGEPDPEPPHGVIVLAGLAGDLPNVVSGAAPPEEKTAMKRSLVMVLALAILAATSVSAPAQSKDTLTVALISIIDTLDPHMHFERVGILVNINMFDSLLHKNVKLEYEPSLATSWKALSDTVWEFKLRKGVRFHNGDTMTAEDVKYSFDRVTEPGKEKKRSPQYGNVRAIKEVRIVNPETIHIATDKPFPLLLERLLFFPLLPKQHPQRGGDPALRHSGPPGTRPW